LLEEIRSKKEEVNEKIAERIVYIFPIINVSDCKSVKEIICHIEYQAQIKAHDISFFLSFFLSVNLLHNLHPNLTNPREING
jgi:hypothetical protein